MIEFSERLKEFDYDPSKNDVINPHILADLTQRFSQRNDARWFTYEDGLFTLEITWQPFSAFGVNDLFNEYERKYFDGHLDGGPQPAHVIVAFIVSLDNIRGTFPHCVRKGVDLFFDDTSVLTLDRPECFSMDTKQMESNGIYVKDTYNYPKEINDPAVFYACKVDKGSFLEVNRNFDISTESESQEYFYSTKSNERVYDAEASLFTSYLIDATHQHEDWLNCAAFFLTKIYDYYTSGKWVQDLKWRD